MDFGVICPEWPPGAPTMSAVQVMLCALLSLRRCQSGCLDGYTRCPHCNSQVLSLEILEYVTELSAKKADGRDRLINVSAPPRALINKDRNMLVTFPSRILASSSSSSFAFSCQKPKMLSTSTSQMVNKYFIGDSLWQPPSQPKHC